MQAKTVKISRTDGTLIGEFPGEDIREAMLNAAKSSANLYGANLYGADLYGADLYGANLYGANLYGANLYGANLRSANLGSADLRSANLRSANLRSANLRSANLYGADLRSANLGPPSMLLLAAWGTLSDEVTIQLMRLDASAHPSPEAFDHWAKGGPCPYSGLKVDRVCLFAERQDLWSPGPPPTIWQAMSMILDEKCPGWRGETEK